MTLNNLKIKPLSKSNFAPYGQVIELKNAEKLMINQGTTTRFNALSSVDVATENGEPIISILPFLRDCLKTFLCLMPLIGGFI